MSMNLPRSREQDFGKLTEVSKEVIWEVADFFALPKDRDLEIYSPEFSFAGKSWRLDMMPNGTDCCSGWIILALENRDEPLAPKPGYLNVDIGLKKDDGMAYACERPLIQFFEGLHILCLSPSEVRENKDTLTPKGSLTVFCRLTINKEEFVVELIDPLPSGIDKLALDLEKLLLNERETDIIIRVMGEEFKAHRSILGARTPVFYSMFEHDMTEKKTGVVVIEDIKPDVFRVFLHFVYSGFVEDISVENVRGLYIVADKYQLDDLKSECVRFMKRNLTPNSVSDIILVALLHDESELFHLASSFFARNLRETIVTENWQNFLCEHPIQANELLIQATSPEKKG